MIEKMRSKQIIYSITVPDSIYFYQPRGAEQECWVKLCCTSKRNLTQHNPNS